MSERWETIVVGAGIGGLTAAAKLVASGLRVLVLERNPHPGGTAAVYHRKGFIFPMGPLGFSNPDLVQDILNELGVGSQFKLYRVHYRLQAFALDIPLSLSFSELVEELGRISPSDMAGVQQFFKCMEEIPLAKGPPPAAGKFSAAKTDQSPFQGSPGISASAYLRGLIADWRLRRILGSIGTREPYTGLSLLAAMWDLMGKQGIWYPREGMQSLPERLVRAVSTDLDRRQNGKGKRGNNGLGEIRLNKEVTEIRIKNGRAVGVILKDGSQIDADAIISNADYKNTFIRLLGPNVVPREWYQAVSRARQTGSLFQVCLGIDAAKVDLSAFKKADRIIYRRGSTKDAADGGLNWDAVEIDPEALAGQELEVSLWNGDEQILSPGEKAVVVIRVEADHRHFARYRSAVTKRIPEYQGYKLRLGRALAHEIGCVIPGLEQAISVMDIATPLTFEDQGGRSEGAVAGWSWDYEDFRDDKPKELIRTPIMGLYMVGYQAFSALFLGGVPTAMESGRRAAQAMLDGAGPLKEMRLPSGK